jgi:hypothetical protein
LTSAARAAIATRGFKDDKQSPHGGSRGGDCVLVKRLKKLPTTAPAQ